MKCKDCDIDFDSIGDLDRHDAIYHLEKSFDEFEPQNQVVVIFQPDHPEIKPYKDSIPQEEYKCCYKDCNKSFFTELLLDLHLEKVHNQKIV